VAEGSTHESSSSVDEHAASGGDVMAVSKEGAGEAQQVQSTTGFQTPLGFTAQVLWFTLPITLTGTSV
jgi:hypothetical protein